MNIDFRDKEKMWFAIYIISSVIVGNMINAYLEAFILVGALFFYNLIFKPLKDEKEQYKEHIKGLEKNIEELEENLEESLEELKNLNPEIIKKKEEEDKDSRILLGKAFEIYVGKQYEKDGYFVEYRGIELGTEDGGIDLIAKKNGQTLLIQCKYYKNRYITSKIAKEFYGSCNFYMDKKYKENSSTTKKNVSCICAIPDKDKVHVRAYELFGIYRENCEYKEFKCNHDEDILPIKNELEKGKNGKYANLLSK